MLKVAGDALVAPASWSSQAVFDCHLLRNPSASLPAMFMIVKPRASISCGWRTPTAWRSARYANQRDPAAFVVTGPEETW